MIQGEFEGGGFFRQVAFAGAQGVGILSQRRRLGLQQAAAAFEAAELP